MTKRILSRTAFALSTVLLSSPAFAFDSSAQMTGAAFSQACTRTSESWISFCNGYIQSAVDSLREGDGICIPRGATRTDMVTVAERAITGSSDLKQMNAYAAVRIVMRKSYPCP